MQEQSAAIIGATGLIGSNLLKLLVAGDSFKTINVIVRHPFESKDPRVRVYIIDFSDRESYRRALAGNDTVFCAVGTTRKKVKGDMDAYRKVDVDIPVNAARICSESGCNRFLLVSSVGADSGSGNFYLKMKGEVEDTIRKMKIPSISVFRPSMLMGKRQEFRFGELIGKVLGGTFSFLMPSKYKPVKASDVAKAVIAVSKQSSAGFKIYHHSEIMDLARNR
jgi:uncharacterized protein YbjT (DUF2867 family)